MCHIAIDVFLFLNAECSVGFFVGCCLVRNKIFISPDDEQSYASAMLLMHRNLCCGALGKILGRILGRILGSHGPHQPLRGAPAPTWVSTSGARQRRRRARMFIRVRDSVQDHPSADHSYAKSTFPLE